MNSFVRGEFRMIAPFCSIGAHILVFKIFLKKIFIVVVLAICMVKLAFTHFLSLSSQTIHLCSPPNARNMLSVFSLFFFVYFNTFLKDKKLLFLSSISYDPLMKLFVDNMT